MALTLAIVASGCAQAPTATPFSSFSSPQKLPRPAVHGYGNDSVYSSQPSNNELLFYKRERNGFTLKLKKTISTNLSSPMGMVATHDGRLYAADSGNSNILVYRATAKGPKGPIATLRDDGEVPVNVDVTPNRRLVAVSNGSTTGGGGGSVSVYLNRKARPARVLRYGSDALQGEGVAIDSNGNCYWSFNDPTTLTGSIVEFAGCNGNGTLFTSGILDAGGMAFDESGNLYYVDQLAGIYKCTGPSSCAILLHIGSLTGLISPRNINFDSGQPQNLWVADAAGYIDAVSLSGLIVYTLETLGGVLDPPIGIAPAPGS